MAFNLSVSAITPPEGLPHANRKIEIMQLPSYLRVTGASGSSELKLIFVSTTAPGADNIDNVWLKPDEALTPEGVSAHGFYRHDSSDGWLLMGGPGVQSGTTVPTDTNVLWLKTDAEAAILTPGGTAVTAPQGLYKYTGVLWSCFTSTPLPSGTKEVYVQATAPTGVADTAWLKTADEKGVWYYDVATSAWINLTSQPTTGTIGGIGFASAYTQVSAAAPLAAIRPYTLWGKTGLNTPNGLFYPDIAGGYWESIGKISIGIIDHGPLGLTTGVLYDTGSLAFTTICSSLEPAYFPVAPRMEISLTDDSQFETGGYLNIGISATAGGFTINAFNASGSSPRNIKINVTATGIMRIPF